MALGRASGHRGQHGDGVAVLDRRLQTPEEAHVLVVQVHVHEPAQAAVGDQPVTQAAVLRVDVLDELTERGTCAFHLLGAVRVGAQDRRDTDLDGHSKLSMDSGGAGAFVASNPAVAGIIPRQRRVGGQAPPVSSTGSSVTTSSTMRYERKSVVSGSRVETST